MLGGESVRWAGSEEVAVAAVGAMGEGVSEANRGYADRWTLVACSRPWQKSGVKLVLG